ncbi:MAG: peptidoglycan-binding protein [Methylocystis sp.]|nr:peptidoglycan-binding protein [Methylocystis sp.]
MLKGAILIVQEYLREKGFYSGKPDGVHDKRTSAAVVKGLNARAAELPEGWREFPDERQAVLMLQLICDDKKIECKPFDGYWGPVTQYAYESLEHLRKTGSLPPNWRDEAALEANPHNWPRDHGNQSEMRAFYGKPGQPPLKKVPCPWTLKLAWDTNVSISHISCHAKVADSLEAVLKRVHAHYGDAELKRLRLNLFGGCLAARKKRGGSTWSTHAWAVAIDWDPTRNQLKWGRDRASLAKSEYDFWWRAWEAEGWVSLGRARNFDWMHVQAARL